LNDRDRGKIGAPSASNSLVGGKVKVKGEGRVQADRVDSDIENQIGQAKATVLSALLDSVLEVVCRVMPSASASITLVNREGTSFTYNPTADPDGIGDGTRDGRAAPLDGKPTESIPLRSGDTTYGALNVYLARVGPVADIDIDLARSLAANIANALALIDASARNLQLEEAISTRQLIGEAKGILMESERCSRDDAFDILRRASQRSNRNLRDIAHDIVDAAERRALDGSEPDPAHP